MFLKSTDDVSLLFPLHSENEILQNTMEINETSKHCCKSVSYLTHIFSKNM